MTGRHRKTLAAIFAEPPTGTIDWADIEALLIAAGSEPIGGQGSRLRFSAGAVTTSFHRPRPVKGAKPYRIKDAREFLGLLGVKP
ncbi:MAG: HicA protein [Deltaproteobacteria bacterium]|nr:HicA protein [Deltaproteobacteria bacterium]